jgi:hypothetical protein
MWSWVNCYLSGRHEFGVWCEPGAIFLRCVHCGRRSSGWAIEPKATHTNPLPVRAPSITKVAVAEVAATPSARVLPFDRAAS